VKERFEGENGRRLLIEAVKEQKLAANNTALSEVIAGMGELVEVGPDTTIIEQGQADNDVYLILTGSFRILVNGRHIATRFPGSHVGEMAAIQPALRRSATVSAAEESVVLRLTEPQVAQLGSTYPEVWLCFARELARRLEQRNALVRPPHDGIRVFVASSTEALPIARAIQNAFEHDPFTVAVWTDDVFGPSEYTIESLECQLDDSDFAIIVAQPDDLTQSRGRSIASPRDNVIFELGLFMARLGRRRTFLVEPVGEEIRLPSDLLGLAGLSYRYGPDLAAAVGPACNRIRKVIEELGPNS
jgi:predicted nucleotide-binding protein